MDEWVWSDAEVAAAVGAGYIAVKLDGDVEKALVERYSVAGFPTTLVLGPDGRETGRAAGYQSSKQLLDLLAPKR
jgi:thiol:disulfide interchange protein